MTPYIICYDLKATSPNPHSEFLNQADKVGWKVWVHIATAKKWYRLPNTTLVGPYSDRTGAKRAFDTAVAATTAALGTSVIVEKYFIAEYSDSMMDSDVKVDV